MFIFSQEHTDSWHYLAHLLEKPWRSDREAVEVWSVTQAEAWCKQPLSFLYLLPRWVGSQLSSTFHSSTRPPHHSLPSRAPPLACEHHDLPLLWILKVQLGLSLVFLTFLPNIQLSCCLLTYCPALTHPSMPPPSPSHLSHPLNSCRSWCAALFQAQTHFLRNLRDCSLTFGRGW